MSKLEEKLDRLGRFVFNSGDEALLLKALRKALEQRNGQVGNHYYMNTQERNAFMERLDAEILQILEGEE